MPSKKLIEAKPCGIELSLALFVLALRDQHIGKTPIDFRIAARKRWLSGDNGLGDAWKAGVLSETCPCATARTLQVDRGDLPVGRGWMRKVKVHDCPHSRLRSGTSNFRDPS